MCFRTRLHTLLHTRFHTWFRTVQPYSRIQWFHTPNTVLCHATMLVSLSCIMANTYVLPSCTHFGVPDALRAAPRGASCSDHPPCNPAGETALRPLTRHFSSRTSSRVVDAAQLTTQPRPLPKAPQGPLGAAQPRARRSAGGAPAGGFAPPDARGQLSLHTGFPLHRELSRG